MEIFNINKYAYVLKGKWKHHGIYYLAEWVSKVVSGLAI